MSEVEIRIGGRTFAVACQPGEEEYLQAAAAMLDGEASALVGQLGKMPDAQMLLMAGLMLADKAVGMEERLRSGGGAASPALPQEAMERLSALAEKAEALAGALEEKAAG